MIWKLEVPIAVTTPATDPSLLLKEVPDGSVDQGLSESLRGRVGDGGRAKQGSKDYEMGGCPTLPPKDKPDPGLIVSPGKQPALRSRAKENRASSAIRARNTSRIKLISRNRWRRMTPIAGCGGWSHDPELHSTPSPGQASPDIHLKRRDARSRLPPVEGGVEDSVGCYLRAQIHVDGPSLCC